MAERAQRAVETRRKKKNRRIARPKQTRVQGNSRRGRNALRKQALLKAGRVEESVGA